MSGCRRAYDTRDGHHLIKAETDLTPTPATRTFSFAPEAPDTS